MERHKRKITPIHGGKGDLQVIDQQGLSSTERGMTSNQKQSSSNCNCWQGWVSICQSWNRMFEKIFYNLGFHVAMRPWIPFLFIFVITGGFIWGFILMDVETRTEQLFVPQDSRAFKDLEVASKHYAVKLRPSNFILTRKDGGNILEKNAILTGLSIHRDIMTKTTFEKSCLRRHNGPILNLTEQNCHMITPLELFRYNPANIINVPIQLTAIYRNLSIYMTNGEIARNNYKEMFGKNVQINNETVISSKVLNFQYASIFHLDEAGNKNNKEWEEDFIRVLQQVQTAVEAGPYKLDYFTPNSVDESTSNSTSKDIKYVAVSFALMITLTTVFFTKPHMPLFSHGMLALGGIILIALSIGVAFGFCMIIGVTFVSIVGILPFVIVGVAIDDMFVILDTLDRTDPTLSIPKRIASSMSRCGATITMTTMTDIFAFMLSTSTKYPAIRYFCIYGVVTLLVSYLFMITGFVALMSLDLKRIKSGRFDYLFCCGKKTDEQEQKIQVEYKSLSQKAMKKFGSALMTTPCRILVIIFSLGLLGAGIYGTTQISQEFDLRMLGQDDSYYIQYLDKQDQLIDESEAINVITLNDIDYSKKDIQDSLAKIDTMMENDTLFINEYSPSWVTAFHKWATAYRQNTTGQYFMRSLLNFVGDPRHPENRRYAARDITFTPRFDGVIASRIVVTIRGDLNSVQQKDAMINIREKADELPFKSYPITYFFVYYEQFASTLSQILIGLAICCIVITVITALYVVHPGIVAILLFSFVGLIVELFGMMALWNVNLNSISMVCLIMSVGFAVDYSAHIAHAYVISDKDTPEERVIDALERLGSSVFMGGFSTAVGIASLGFASSGVFRVFFKMFFGIVVLGLLNGLIINPVYMSVLCRSQLNDSDVYDDASNENYPNQVELEEKQDSKDNTKC